MQRDWLNQIKKLNSPVGDASFGMLSFYERFDQNKYGNSGGPLHDPMVIAYLLHPEIFKGKLANVEIEIYSELTMGMTVVDWWGVTERGKNVNVISKVDPDKYFDLIIEKLKLL